ncbi:nucleotide disphospho-sugar-binding domain-containing protein [Amycolatopsis sp. lyj-90]|uniref:nucleotide disphospho-sugar-binding domain-containing protein n=1 Tax=Amycolatopsis sp. lyj-90 TaxID=2789285 RepID=UPI00397C8418
MRVLLVTSNWPSHYFQLVPLVWALRADGHEIFVNSQPGFTETIVRSGAIAAPSGVDIELAEAARLAAADPPREWPADPPTGVSEEDWNGGWREVSRKAFPMFVKAAELQVDGVIGLAKALRPDVVVYEPTALAGPIAAAAIGVPAVRHVLGVDVVYMARELIAPLLAPITDRLGIGRVDPVGAATIDNCPPSMQLESDVTRLGIRFVPYNGAGTLPGWLLEPAEKPRICVSWGLSASARGRGFLVPSLVESLHSLDAEIIVAISTADRKNLGPLPSDVRVVESMPLHLLMPSLSAMLHQSGMGTMLTALSFGVPQLVVPQMPDELMESRPLGAAGIALPSEEADLGAFQLAAADLLRDPAYRKAAEEVRDEIREQPSPAETVIALEELVRTTK